MGFLEVTANERRFINLALACFGTDKEIFKALYKYSREDSQTESEADYKRGLRLGCLSNETIGAGNWVWRFPGELIGDEEVDRIIASGDRNELEAPLPRANLRRSQASGTLVAIRVLYRSDPN